MSGFLGKEPESCVWRVGYGYAAAIREGAGENPFFFLGLYDIWHLKTWNTQVISCFFSPICSQCPNDLLQLVSEAFIFSPSYFSCRSTSTPRPWIQQEAKVLSGRNWGILSCTRLVMCTILALDALSTMHYVAILARKALTLPPGQCVDGAICINFYQNLAHLPLTSRSEGALPALSQSQVQLELDEIQEVENYYKRLSLVDRGQSTKTISW